MKITRQPYVDGKFYPGSDSGIRKLMKTIREKNKYPISEETDIHQVIGAVLPHAGHIYSGYQTVPFFEFCRIRKCRFDSFIILHPIHNGGFQPYATDSSTHWSTPMGKMEVDREFLENMDIHISDHLLKYEHSAEVILPFLQFFGYENKKIIPIGISLQTPEISREISLQISNTVKKTGRKICILASSDFSHFLDPIDGYNKDSQVVDKIHQMDIDALYERVVKEKISICGYGPIMILIDYCVNNFDNPKSKVLARGHSGQVCSSSKVVNYISMLFYN